MNNKLIGLGVLVALIAITLNSSLFVVGEGRQAIITQFGRPVDAVSKAGLHFKKPFLQEVRYIDKRILSWDGYPSEIPTRDKKYIKVDTTARWRIVDPLKFIQTVQNERGAKARLDAILDALTRDVISAHNLVEAVRNSNSILDDIEQRREEIKALRAAGEPVVDEEISGDIEKIRVGRERLSEMIAVKGTTELKELGIELIDVQLRRISYEKSVEQKVYERMISERQRVAQKIRSIGQGEKAKIEGRLERDLQRIQSRSYRKVQKVKGEAEAKATAIYASSLSQDPQFFAFIRSLEAYDKVLKGKSKFLLSSDSEFLKYLKKDR